MDNDGGFYVDLLDDLLCCKSSICGGSMTTYYLTVIPDSDVAQLVEQYCTVHCIYKITGRVLSRYLKMQHF